MCVMASQPAPAPLVLSLKAAALSDNAQCVTLWQEAYHWELQLLLSHMAAVEGPAAVAER